MCLHVRNGFEATYMLEWMLLCFVHAAGRDAEAAVLGRARCANRRLEVTRWGEIPKLSFLGLCVHISSICMCFDFSCLLMSPACAEVLDLLGLRVSPEVVFVCF